jgi:enoyl-CoA hydratase/carnithine racemase
MPVRLELDSNIATIVIDRPEKLNALTLDMLAELEAHVAALEQNASMRAVILTGAGHRSFCVGADIKAWSDLDALAMWRKWIREGHRVFDRLASLHLPTLAALNGYTFGGGLELALAADLRLAADGIELALPEVKLGIVPGWAGTQRLPALVGPARAKQMIFTGASISAETALAWGLINETVEPDALLDRARALAGAIAGHAPLAVQMAKQLLDGGQGIGTGYRLEALASGLARFTDDAAEGIASFNERRPPRFKGT